MAQHADSSKSSGAARAQVVGVIAAVIKWIGLICTLVLVIHVLLTVGSANPANGITSFFADVADPIALGFKDLFTPSDPKLLVLVNYGIAALFWLIVSSVVARIVRRFG
ncbi:hypothetical protein [Kibdelosporangium phytohabitans]|uniref:YggT family protein n=1 Tax=Kibdelosporangium phytohabitans TaxID=860235 RepID=A0A0N9HV23_9PSEU|nr:hypothetical protein [Kibdelosporangium phytohabitans]ALG05741.1 hypothetical protein AOZ06_01320 [Kibdelosporangium phytohabitans]MBE1466263.1 glycerol-3-phosphate acyltransferase PlsY [Kibdelosporangium phytohabitans]